MLPRHNLWPFESSTMARADFMLDVVSVDNRCSQPHPAPQSSRAPDASVMSLRGERAPMWTRLWLAVSAWQLLAVERTVRMSGV